MPTFGPFVLPLQTTNDMSVLARRREVAKEALLEEGAVGRRVCAYNHIYLPVSVDTILW